jgi:hypothetical protein
MTATENKTVVHFHIGRGGRYNNAGHRTFEGIATFQEVISEKSDSLFYSRENYSSILKDLESRNLTNLVGLLESCSDRDDFSDFEAKTGLSVGEPVHTDCNGTIIVEAEDFDSLVGSLNWDYEYDTDVCQYLEDCDENDLLMIANSRGYRNEDIIQEYFDKSTDLVIDWSRFNGEYADLIEEYFNSRSVDVTEFYNEDQK